MTFTLFFVSGVSGLVQVLSTWGAFSLSCWWPLVIISAFTGVAIVYWAILRCWIWMSGLTLNDPLAVAAYCRSDSEPSNGTRVGQDFNTALEKGIPEFVEFKASFYPKTSYNLPASLNKIKLSISLLQTPLTVCI